jgi:hypothetical protein
MAMPHQKACFDYLWAIWRVKAAALLRHNVADFSAKNQALTRKIARPQLFKDCGEPEWAPKSFLSETNKSGRPLSNLRWRIALKTSA